MIAAEVFSFLAGDPPLAPPAPLPMKLASVRLSPATLPPAAPAVNVADVLLLFSTAGDSAELFEPYVVELLVIGDGAIMVADGAPVVVHAPGVVADDSVWL